MNAFTKDARKYGEQAKFVEQAKLEMEKKLKEIFLIHGIEVTIQYSSGERINPL